MRKTTAAVLLAATLALPGCVAYEKPVSYGRPYQGWGHPHGYMAPAPAWRPAPYAYPRESYRHDGYGYDHHWRH
jgi:hypothetical protein